VFGRVRDVTQASTTGSNEQASNETSRMTNSDRRLKTNVTKIGTHPMGIGLYLFEYVDRALNLVSGQRHFGVMADEVERVLPAAVSTGAHGFKQVNYDMLGIASGSN
jgi:hypothetical protein